MANYQKIQPLTKFILVRIDSQYFGIPVEHIVDVVPKQKIYPIPLAPKEINGSINLRGRIVTALDIVKILDIHTYNYENAKMCIVLEYFNEMFSIQVDEVGNVYNFSLDSLIKTPDNLSDLWKNFSFGIYNIKEDLVVILDIQKAIDSIIKAN